MKNKEFLYEKAICLNTGEVFEECREASEKYGVSHPNRILTAASSEKLQPSGVHPTKKVKLYWATPENYSEKKKLFDESDKIAILANKKVICLNTKEIFDSAPLAAAHYKLPTVYNLLKACKSQKISNGRCPITDNCLYWAFVEDYEKEGFKMPRIIELATEPRKVICLNTKQIFDDIDEAREFIGFKTSITIDKSCQAFDYPAGIDRITKEKLYWAYLEDFKSGKKREYPKLRKKMRKAYADNGSEESKNAVICLNTKREFKDADAAARWCGIKRSSTIVASCNSERRSAGKHPKTGEKLYWSRLIDFQNGVKTKYPGNGIEIPRRKIYGISRRVSVICLNNKKVFKNVYEAAELYGIEDPVGIVNSYKSEWLSCGEHPLTEEKLYWAKLSDYKSGIKTKYPGKGMPREYNNKNKGVHCKTTGESFESVLLAANYFGIVPAIKVTEACKDKEKTAGLHPITKIPLTWEYIREEIRN